MRQAHTVVAIAIVGILAAGCGERGFVAECRMRNRPGRVQVGATRACTIELLGRPDAEDRERGVLIYEIGSEFMADIDPMRLHIRIAGDVVAESWITR